MDTVQFCCHSNKINCIGCGCYYELLVVLAINEATAAMETVDGLVCCDWLGWWCVTANGDGGITEFECPTIWLAASRPVLPVLVLWLVIAANDVALVAMVSASPAPAPAAAMPTMSSMLVCAIIFWRTSLILSCKQTLVGNTSWYFAWKADVAWAENTNNFFLNWTKIIVRDPDKGVGTTTPHGRGGGCQPITWNNFGQKLHENERKWAAKERL